MSGRVTINRVAYKKSSYSRDDRHCVGAGFRRGCVSVVNTKTDGPAVRFTIDEWNAFLKGVKDGEFEIELLPRWSESD
jgi:hypothetical protein